MKLNTKITILLFACFLAISAAFLFTSLNSLGQSQSDNLGLFKDEFAQTTLESFQNLSDLFFGFIDNEIGDDQIGSRADILAYVKKLDPDGARIILIDLNDKNFISDHDNPRLRSVIGQKSLDSFIGQWTLNQKNDFSIDNFDAFLSGKTMDTPVKVRLKIYKPFDLIVGYGDVFETGKVRVAFVQNQNK